MVSASRFYDQSEIIRTENNNKKPDFIGITNDDKRIVLEAKGWASRRKEGIDNAKEQLRSVLSVDGEKNILKVASIFYEKNSEQYLEVIDPKEEGLLKVSSLQSDYLKDYYAKVFFMMKKGVIKVVKIGGCDFITSDIDCGFLKVGLLQSVYEILNNNSKEKYVTDTITDVLFDQYEYLEKAMEGHFYSIGFDGIFVGVNG